MIRITLGASGLCVSPIAFGTWQLSRKYWGPQDKDDIVAAIWEAFDHGVNLIDTAEAYGAGFAETVVGEAIRHLPRDEIVIATKVYKNFSEDGEGYPDLTARQIIRRCEGSLRRLGVDTIDIYFLHFFDPLTPFEETAAAMERLLQQGKVRALGLSNHTVEQIRAHRRYAPYTVVQPFYSLIDPRIEDDLLPFCQTEGLGVMIYSPLHMGSVVGKVRGNRGIPRFPATSPGFPGGAIRAAVSSSAAAGTDCRTVRDDHLSISVDCHVDASRNSCGHLRNQDPAPDRGSSRGHGPNHQPRGLLFD